MSLSQLQKSIATLIQIRNKMWKPLDSHIHVRRERKFTWRGEDLPEGRTHTVIEVPNELVEEVLSISGKHGLIVDFVMRDREAKKKHDEECVRVKLPEECSIKDAIKKHEELQKKSKEAVRGIVPTRRGYAIRAKKEAEAEVTREVNPDEAKRLGPALGIKMSKAWVISGIPSYADSGMIVTTLAQGIQGWPGWVVRPKRPLSANRGRLSTWLVESAVEPPAPVITLNNYIIQIEGYIDRSPTSVKARAWLDIKPKPLHKIVPGQIYEETDQDAPRAPMEVEDPVDHKNDIAGAKGSGSGIYQAHHVRAELKKKDGKDVVMQDAETEEAQQRLIPTKRRALNDENGSYSGRTQGEDAMARLQERLEKKEAQVDTLLQTSKDLSDQGKALHDMIAKMQATQTAQSEGSNDTEENL